MNKASSIFLDQFATEKLIADKLSQVSHIPGPPVAPFRITDLDEEPLSPVEAEFKETSEILTFRSPLESEYRENNTALVNIYPVSKAKGCILFAHGLFEESRTIYKFLFMLLNKLGYTIYLYILPYHYERKPSESLFSGEFFWSANFRRSLTAFQQAVKELYLLSLYLKDREQLFLGGFSMGAVLLINLAAGTELNHKLFFISPGINLIRQMWESPLWQTIKQDLRQWQVPVEDIERVYNSVSPHNWTSLKTRPQNMMCVCGEYDQLINSQETLEFFSRFPGTTGQLLKCGHLNMLRIPRLAEDMDRFFSGGHKREAV